MKKLGWTIIVIVILALAGGAGYLWYTNQQLTETNSQNESNISSLRRQLAEAQASPSPTPAPSATPAPATPVPAVTLKQFSVSFVPSATIADVAAAYQTASKDFAFTSTSLAAKGGSCGGPALGVVARVAKGGAAPAGATKVATVGAYDYYYSSSQASCNPADATASELQTTQAEALKTALAGLK